MGRFSVGDELFIPKKTMKRDHVPGDIKLHETWVVRLMEEDEFPKGRPGWWVTLIRKRRDY